MGKGVALNLGKLLTWLGVSSSYPGVNGQAHKLGAPS